MYSNQFGAVLEGYIAFSGGKTIEQNPYPIDHYLHQAWKDGWQDADKQEWIESKIDIDETY